MSYATKNGLAVLICLNSNCHSTSFGNENNKRGEKLDECIAENHLIIENQGREYTFETKTAHTIIDITLSTRLSVSVINWKVCKENNFSDHNAIYFDLVVEFMELAPQRNWNKADWDVFEHKINKREVNLRKTTTPQRMEKDLGKFYTNINKSLDAACPKTNAKTVDKNNPWWTKELQDKRSHMSKII